MGVTELIIEVLFTFIEGFIWILFGKDILNDNNQINKLFAFVLLVIHTTIVTMLNGWEIVSAYTGIVSTLVMAGIMFVLFKAKPIYCIMTAITYYILLIVIEMFWICLFSVVCGNPNYIMDIVQQSNDNRIIYGVFMKCLNIVIYLIIRKRIRRINCKILGNPLYAILSFLTFFITLRIMNLIMENSIVSLKLGISLLFIVFIVTFCGLIFLTNHLFNEKLKSTENEYINIKNKILEKNLKDINHLYEDNSKNFHEFKHHIDILNSLLTESSNSKAVEYLKSINLYSKYSQEFYSGCEIIDTVLNVKNIEAKQQNINLSVDININEITINDADLCSVLSNLIDNAIEATEKTEKERLVKIYINQKGNMIFLKVKNPCQFNPKISNFSTTKTGNHGWGIKIINDIVNKYNGTITNQYEDKNIVIKVMLVQ